MNFANHEKKKNLSEVKTPLNMLCSLPNSSSDILGLRPGLWYESYFMDNIFSVFSCIPQLP